VRDEVARLVLATKTHKAAEGDVNAAVLSDADLAVLGGPAVRYRGYAAAVREEYASIPDEVFKPARAQILSALLDGPIFHTEAARARWEDQARRNVGAEIAELTA
jgi:predicted metal-dependent HD superfamily phosphohydrolase